MRCRLARRSSSMSGTQTQQAKTCGALCSRKPQLSAAAQRPERWCSRATAADRKCSPSPATTPGYSRRYWAKSRQRGSSAPESLGQLAARTTCTASPRRSRCSPSRRPSASPSDRLTVLPCGRLPDMDWKIELVAIPVTDVDRAKDFYVNQVGFNADHDYQVNDALRFVQLTPPGSACSIVMGTAITDMPPGSQRGVQVVVADVDAARRDRPARGGECSEVHGHAGG